MGEDVTLNLRLRQALGSENPNEINQCVIKHLALGLDWFVNGKKLRIPNRSRVDILATELRAGEFSQAQQCMEQIGAAKTQIQLELMAAVHDAMSVGHDRSYKRLGWWMKALRPDQIDFCIRIFDAECSSDVSSVIVYQYSMTSSALSPLDSINMVVTNGHIRFLLPSKETYPGSWKRWMSFVSEVRDLSWMSWQESLELDEGLQPLITFPPCSVCGKKCKAIQPSCVGLAGPALEPHHNDVGWWQKPNPWLHSAGVDPLDTESLDLSNRDEDIVDLNSAPQPWKNRNV